MKLQALKGLISLAFVCGIAGAEPIQLQGTVPFDFRVGDVLMHAGQYRVEATNTLIAIQDRTTGDRVYRLVLPGSRKRGSRLDATMVFTRYGGEYNLTSVWTSGSAQGDVLTPTKRQREQELASKASKVTQVPLLASR